MALIATVVVTFEPFEQLIGIVLPGGHLTAGSRRFRGGRVGVQRHRRNGRVRRDGELHRCWTLDGRFRWGFLVEDLRIRKHRQHFRRQHRHVGLYFPPQVILVDFWAGGGKILLLWNIPKTVSCSKQTLTNYDARNWLAVGKLARYCSLMSPLSCRNHSWTFSLPHTRLPRDRSELWRGKSKSTWELVSSIQPTLGMKTNECNE